MADKAAKIKELKQLLDEGSITEEEFSQMKADLIKEDTTTVQDSQTSKNASDKKRTGVSWPELLGVLLGPIGGIGYLFTKQGILKKIVILFLSFIASGIYASISDSPSPNGTNSSNSGEEQSSTPADSAISVGTFSSVRNNRDLRVDGSEVLDSIQTNNQFMGNLEPKGGKLVAVYMTIENTGNESGNMLWTEFKLRDNQGRSFDDIEDFEELMIVNTWADDKGLSDPSGQLFPGATAEIVKVFRVSPDAEGLELTVNNQSFAIN